jgi:hypothetical protein
MDKLQDHMINHEEKDILEELEVYATQDQLIAMGKEYKANKEKAPTRPHPWSKIKSIE